MASAAGSDTRHRGPRRSARSVRVASVGLVALLAAVITLMGPVKLTASDTAGTLAVSQQLLTTGTVRVDGLGAPWDASNYRTVRLHGNLYWYFPLGAPLVAVPFAAVAFIMGQDPASSDAGLQVGTAALFASLTVLLLYWLAREWLPHATALGLAGVFWAGTSLASTNSTALWSHVPAVAFALAAILLMLRATRSPCAWCWLPYGASLFMAYLSRPTMAVPVVLLLGYTALKDWRTAARSALLVAGLMILLVIWSHSTMGEWLPPYYQPGRLSNGGLAPALVSSLVGPSRGLIVYAPWLVVLAATAWVTHRQWRPDSQLVGLGLLWTTSIVLIVSSFDIWYGGLSYGPRLLTDALPALYLILVVTWPRTRMTAHPWLIAGWILTATLSVAMHTGSMFNAAVTRWNATPSHDLSEFVNDWAYPQFLHTDARQLERAIRYGQGVPTGVGYRDFPFGSS